MRRSTRARKPLAPHNVSLEAVDMIDQSVSKKLNPRAWKSNDKTALSTHQTKRRWIKPRTTSQLDTVSYDAAKARSARRYLAALDISVDIFVFKTSRNLNNTSSHPTLPPLISPTWVVKARLPSKYVETFFARSNAEN